MNKTENQATVEKKLVHLKEVLSSLESACVAFSGGVDSTFLLSMAKEVLGNNVIAVTATSPTYPEHELKEARALAESLNVRHIVISSNELEIPGFSENRPDRCYYCKNDLFGKLREVADALALRHIVDGSNYDDVKDYRPGRKAAGERGVRSPLIEAKLTKDNIRFISHRRGLKTWNKPSLACLSSRIPYGVTITEEKLRKIEAAEQQLKNLGFTQFRVRYHDSIARLEFISEEMGLLSNFELRKKISSALKIVGFKYVTVDLEGYRSGSMNEVLEP